MKEETKPQQSYLTINLQHIDGTTLVTQFLINCLHALHDLPTVIQTKTPRMKYSILISDEWFFQREVEGVCFATYELFHTLLKINFVIAPHRIDKTPVAAFCLLCEVINAAYKFRTCFIILSWNLSDIWIKLYGPLQ